MLSLIFFTVFVRHGDNFLDLIETLSVFSEVIDRLWRKTKAAAMLGLAVLCN